MLAREQASLWREHVVAVVNLVPRSHSVLAVGDLGTRLSSRHSTTSFSENAVVAETGYQMLEVLLFFKRESA